MKDFTDEDMDRCCGSGGDNGEQQRYGLEGWYMIMGPWLIWVYAAFFIICGLLIGFTVRGLVSLLSGWGAPLDRNRGWLVLPVCAVFFVWLPWAYNLPMNYIPFGLLATVVARIIILY